MLLQGKKISANDALNLGLIADVFGDAEFSAKSMEVLETLSNLPTKAIALTKKAFNHSYENDLKEQLDLEGIYQQDEQKPKISKKALLHF